MEHPNFKTAIQNASKKIAPMWPLKNFVAVNPYLGLAQLSFESAAKLLAERSSIKMTLPISFYLEQYENGNITNADITEALKKNNKSQRVDDFMQEAKLSEKVNFPDKKLKTIIDIVDETYGLDLNQLMIDNTASWAASYFDQHQAIWNNKNFSEELFKEWKTQAQFDRSPEIYGIKEFRKTILSLPEGNDQTSEYILTVLNLPSEKLDAYLHSLLLKLVGWSSYISGLDFSNNVYNKPTEKLDAFLTILLSWEYAVLQTFQTKDVTENWFKNLNDFTKSRNPILEKELLLQDAFDIAHQRELKAVFSTKKEKNVLQPKVKAQAVFCIDVRSEVIRRNIETSNPEIETLGFAGFFGLPINYKPIANNEGNNQCPVLLPSGPVVQERYQDSNTTLKKEKNKKISDQFIKAFKNFKTGAVSSFSYVSPLGLYFLPKLIQDSYGLKLPKLQKENNDQKSWSKKGKIIDLSLIPLAQQIEMAAGALTGMGIKNQMSRLIFIVGHGSTSANNPHASGLDCGACGGHSGEINALTSALILNNPSVRIGLEEKGIQIPEDTLFIAGLHDTTSDEIHILAEDDIDQAYKQELQNIKKSFAQAAQLSRSERAAKLFIKNGKDSSALLERGYDWSQIRPEWGLAGCSSFVVAPRSRTSHLNLGGKAFMHNYDWQNDDQFKILEAIMTAPMVVTSWINLQYFASVTDNKHFGAGNKTLHNVTAGIGVIEGSGGDLRTGLPLQSVHDGSKFQHLPQRLCVLIEAPTEAINNILAKHPKLKELFDNSWISLFRIGSEGSLEEKYISNLNWKTFTAKQIDKKALQTI